MNLVEVLAGEIGPRPAGSEAAGRAAQAVASAFRELGVEPTFQEFPFLAYEPDEPELEVDGEPWRAGPVMYGQSADVEGTVRRIGTHVVLPTLFEPPAFAIEADGRELARIYGNPIRGGPTPFPTGYGPTLTGPGAFVSAADAERLRDGAYARLRCGGSFVPVTERNVLAEVPGETDETIVACAHYDSAWRAGGAVDNASGVEGVRRIVERLARPPAPSHAARDRLRRRGAWPRRRALLRPRRQDARRARTDQGCRQPGVPRARRAAGAVGGSG